MLRNSLAALNQVLKTVTPASATDKLPPQVLEHFQLENWRAKIYSYIAELRDNASNFSVQVHFIKLCFALNPQHNLQASQKA